MENELFSKCVLLDANRSVGVMGVPGGGIAMEGITYDPDTGVSSTQRITFSTEAAVILTEILNEWANRPLNKD